MHDAHAVFPLRSAVVNEVGEPRSRLIDGHAMQVDLCLDAVAAALQFPHRPFANVLAMKAQGGTVAVFDRVNVVLEALGQHPALVGFRKFRFGLGLRFRHGHARFALERLDATHCLAKIVRVFVVAHGSVFEAMVRA